MHTAIIHPQDMFYGACNEMFPFASFYPAWCRRTCADEIYRRALTPDITPDSSNTSHKTNKGWRRSQSRIIVVHLRPPDHHSRNKKRTEVQPREKSIQRRSQDTLSSRFWQCDGTNHLILRKFGGTGFPWEQIVDGRNPSQLIKQIVIKAQRRRWKIRVFIFSRVGTIVDPSLLRSFAHCTQWSFTPFIPLLLQSY